MEDDHKISKVKYINNHWLDLPPILNLSSGDQTKIKMLEMKTTSNGRRPQNNKSWISQQHLIGSSSNFKLTLRGPNQNKKCLKWRRPQMEVRGKYEENTKEISSVALLSPACLLVILLDSSFNIFWKLNYCLKKSW